MRCKTYPLAAMVGAGLACWLASCAMPEGFGPAPAPALPAGADASAHAGQAVYASQCATCHGRAGHGDGPAAREMNVDVPDLCDAASSDGDEELFAFVTRGRKPMPAFRDLLTDRQRWDVVHYVRAAFAPAPPSSRAQAPDTQPRRETEGARNAPQRPGRMHAS